MKNYLLLLTIATGFSSFAVAQKEEKEHKISNPPVAAKTAFTKNFPAATGATWEKEGKNYEVNFKQNKQQMSAEFDAAGALQETEATIQPTELPAPANDYIKKHYKSARVKEAAKITKANSEINYEAEVNGMDLIFDKDGKFIKVEKD